MSIKTEAQVLELLRPSNCCSRPVDTTAIVRVGLTLFVVVLAATQLAAPSAGQSSTVGRSDANANRNVAADRGAARALCADCEDTRKLAPSKVPLFFGYIEFDYDPDQPGGVPGFGPWPPVASTNAAVARSPAAGGP